MVTVLFVTKISIQCTNTNQISSQVKSQHKQWTVNQRACPKNLRNKKPFIFNMQDKYNLCNL